MVIHNVRYTIPVEESRKKQKIKDNPNEMNNKVGDPEAIIEEVVKIYKNCLFTVPSLKLTGMHMKNVHKLRHIWTLCEKYSCSRLKLGCTKGMSMKRACSLALYARII